MHWGGDETLKQVLISVAQPCLLQYRNDFSLNLPGLFDPRGLRETQTEYFSLITHTKQFFLVLFCDTTAGIQNC